MPLHPLEPLAASEVMQAVSLLKTLPGFTPTTRIISIMLREPTKTAIYEWNETEEGVRSADAVLFDNARNAAFTVRLDLTANAIVEWRPAPEGAQPTLSMDEQIECEQAVLASEVFRDALQRHYGISDTVWSWWISGAPAIMDRKKTARGG